MDLLDERSSGDVMIKCLHTSKWAERMQRGAGEDGNVDSGFNQRVVDCDQGNEAEEKDLNDFADSDVPSKKPMAKESILGGCFHNSFSLDLVSG